MDKFQSIHLRQNIAKEAARLLKSGQASHMSEARQIAACQLHRGRVPKNFLPSLEEINSALFETQVPQYVREFQMLQELILWLTKLKKLFEFIPLFMVKVPDYSSLQQQGSFFRIGADASISEIEETLTDAGEELQADIIPDSSVSKDTTSFFIRTERLEFELYSITELFFDTDKCNIPLDDVIDVLGTFTHPVTKKPDLKEVTDWSMAFELLPLLAGIRVDSHEHPEGDLFYHSCQVFEAGLQLEPHDTEFLEACLFHDLGWIQNFKKPQEASVYILKGIATPRTLFFIQELPVAHEYLKSGKIKNSLRKSTDFDLLIELARLDRKCRIPGADVQELDAIEEYLQQYGD